MIVVRDLRECADLFMKYGVNFSEDNADGPFRCGALFVLSQLACLSEYDRFLFDVSGSLGGEVRSACVKDCACGGLEDGLSVPPEDDRILRFVCDVFGGCSLDELKSVLKELSFRDDGMPELLSAGRYGSVSIEPSEEDLFKIRLCYNAYKDNRSGECDKVVFNGVSFYIYDFDVTEDLLNDLLRFSSEADEDAYVVCMDGGRPVCF